MIIIIGFVAWRRGRERGLRILRYAVLLNILVGQVFSFHERQLDALPGVIINLIALGVLNHRLSSQEQPADDAVSSQEPA